MTKILIAIWVLLILYGFAENYYYTNFKNKL